MAEFSVVGFNPKIEKALRIEGWMQQVELAWLAEQAEKHTRILEVGSWLGRSTRALADNTKGKVYAVDTWEGSDEPEHERLLKDKPHDWLYQEFLRNKAENVLTIRKTSLQAAYRMEPGTSFDMIFLDASHDYWSVMSDILAWQPLLSQGGLLCGHDYDKKYWPEVVRAVDELLPTARRAAGSIWEVV